MADTQVYDQQAVFLACEQALERAPAGRSFSDVSCATTIQLGRVESVEDLTSPERKDSQGKDSEEQSPESSAQMNVAEAETQSSEDAYPDLSGQDKVNGDTASKSGSEPFSVLHFKVPRMHVCI